MILYYFPIAQNTVNKTEICFQRSVYACICMCTYMTIFLFTGLIPVYPSPPTRYPRNYAKIFQRNCNNNTYTSKNILIHIYVHRPTSCSVSFMKFDL